MCIWEQYRSPKHVFGDLSFFLLWVCACACVLRSTWMWDVGYLFTTVYNPLCPSCMQHVSKGVLRNWRAARRWLDDNAMPPNGVSFASWPFWYFALSIIKVGTLTWPPCGLRQGLVGAMLGVLRLEPGGLLTAGLPCHSYVYLNRSTSKRSKGKPLGDQSKAYVRLSNMLLGLIIFVFIYWNSLQLKNNWMIMI